MLILSKLYLEMHLIYTEYRFDYLLPNDSVWTLELKGTHFPYLIF